MPEMPEVETMVERMQRWVGHQVIKTEVLVSEGVNARERYLSGQPGAADGQTITGVWRRGKFIIIGTTQGALLAHNAMSGFWDSSDEPWTFDYVEGRRESTARDVRVQLKLAEPVSFGEFTLRFHDARMFGSLRYVDPAELADKMSKVGPEIDDSPYNYDPTSVITAEQFAAALNKNKPVKDLLMSQDRVAGLGNIYAAEALWHARILPTRPGSSLSQEELGTLLVMCRSVVRQALDRQLSYDGLKVYRRKACTCGAKIQSEKIKGRSTYWCPTCQK